MNNTAQSSSDQTHAINRSLHRLMVPAPTIALDGDNPRREELERFIGDRFRLVHNAVIREFLPYLLSIRHDDSYHAALGIRPATLNPLFVEHYLDTPAEQVIASLSRCPVDRSGIVEIGNLVSSRPGATALLFLTLLDIIHRGGFLHVMFTATPPVIRAIDRLGFSIQVICPAEPSRLPGGASEWGDYYTHNPQVVVGFVADSIAACRSHQLMDSIVATYGELLDNFAARLQARVQE
ncbi:MAG: thermostable hemolysin [Porticoccaceae bacterium]|nr:thermostable hemolysin [Porticoccaceae bacterium]